MLVTLHCTMSFLHTCIYYSKLYIIAGNPKLNPKHTPLKIKVPKGGFCNDAIEEPFCFPKEPFRTVLKRTSFL